MSRGDGLRLYAEFRLQAVRDSFRAIFVIVGEVHRIGSSGSRPSGVKKEGASLADGALSKLSLPSPERGKKLYVINAGTSCRFQRSKLGFDGSHCGFAQENAAALIFRVSSAVSPRASLTTPTAENIAPLPQPEVGGTTT